MRAVFMVSPEGETLRLVGVSRMAGAPGLELTFDRKPTEQEMGFVYELYRRIPPRPIPTKFNERDVEWIAAISIALGADSGHNVPLAPDIDLFKSLFHQLALHSYRAIDIRAAEQLPPEFDEAGKDNMREKARARNSESFGHMSDEWVADRVRMLMRNDMYHEAICTAGRDRIMRLSLQVAQLKEELKTLRAGVDLWQHLNKKPEEALPPPLPEKDLMLMGVDMGSAAGDMTGISARCPCGKMHAITYDSGGFTLVPSELRCECGKVSRLADLRDPFTRYPEGSLFQRHDSTVYVMTPTALSWKKVAKIEDRQPFCELEPDNEHHDLRGGVVCLMCYNRVAKKASQLREVPSAWMRPVRVAGHPAEPVEHDVELCYGDDSPEGTGWIPLYVRRSEEEQAVLRLQEINPDHVICPACAHQFRAIPLNVQQKISQLSGAQAIDCPNCKGTGEYEPGATCLLCRGCKRVLVKELPDPGRPVRPHRSGGGTPAPGHDPIGDMLRAIPIAGTINVDNPRDPIHKEWKL